MFGQFYQISQKTKHINKSKSFVVDSESKILLCVIILKKEESYGKEN